MLLELLGHKTVNWSLQIISFFLSGGGGRGKGEGGRGGGMGISKCTSDDKIFYIYSVYFLFSFLLIFSFQMFKF